MPSSLSSVTVFRSGQSYINCLADALTEAERSGVCSPLSVLTYRHDAFREAGIYDQNCSVFGEGCTCTGVCVCVCVCVLSLIHI